MRTMKVIGIIVSIIGFVLFCADMISVINLNIDLVAETEKMAANATVFEADSYMTAFDMMRGNINDAYLFILLAAILLAIVLYAFSRWEIPEEPSDKVITLENMADAPTLNAGGQRTYLNMDTQDKIDCITQEISVLEYWQSEGDNSAHIADALDRLRKERDELNR